MYNVKLIPSVNPNYAKVLRTFSNIYGAKSDDSVLINGKSSIILNKSTVKFECTNEIVRICFADGKLKFSQELVLFAHPQQKDIREKLHPTNAEICPSISLICLSIGKIILKK